MLFMAGQTAGPIELKFVVDTHVLPGVLKAENFFKNFKFCFFFKNVFHVQRRSLLLVNT